MQTILRKFLDTTLSAQRVKRAFCSSFRVLRSFSSLRLSRWRAVLYSGQGEQSYSDGSILPYQSSSRTLAYSISVPRFIKKCSSHRGSKWCSNGVVTPPRGPETLDLSGFFDPQQILPWQMKSTFVMVSVSLQKPVKTLGPYAIFANWRSGSTPVLCLIFPACSNCLCDISLSALGTFQEALVHYEHHHEQRQQIHGQQPRAYVVRY